MPREKPRLSTKLRHAPTRYEPVSKIAVGGMAEVWRANAVFQAGDSHPVAIKRVISQLASQPLYRSLFQDEARLGMMLQHPNIVRVYDAREVSGTLIMIMELVDGTTLRNILESAQQRQAPMPIAPAMYIARELSLALDYAHNAEDGLGKSLGIVHRDVSPHNLLISRDGDVKLTDFGLANANSNQTDTGKNMVGGKLGYLAPEVIRQEATGAPVDVFATGIILWESLTGKRLFLGNDDPETVRNVSKCVVPPPSVFNPACTPDIDKVVIRSLASHPEQRVSSASAFATELTQLLEKHDRGVGRDDMALIVGLHLAQQTLGLPLPSLLEPESLVQDLAQFVAAAAADQGNIGAAPLDPEEFAALVRGARPK